MDYIFEDFFTGFLTNFFSDKLKVESQKSDLYLTSAPKAFQMQHDIFITPKYGKKVPIIVDTKYKIRGSDFKSDLKKGISQADLYQMTSYAFRRGCNDVVLVYPNISEELNSSDSFEIVSGFDDRTKVRVRAIEVPFWSMTNFDGLEEKLIRAIEESLIPSSSVNYQDSALREDVL
jgi:5-methylcytosine-specific restriction enzyme subunit McrC